MAISPYAAWMLAQEARSLLTRLARVKPFALIEPMLPAAALLPGAQTAIERHLVLGRRELRALVAPRAVPASAMGAHRAPVAGLLSARRAGAGRARAAGAAGGEPAGAGRAAGQPSPGRAARALAGGGDGGALAPAAAAG